MGNKSIDSKAKHLIGSFAKRSYSLFSYDDKVNEAGNRKEENNQSTFKNCVSVHPSEIIMETKVQAPD